MEQQTLPKIFVDQVRRKGEAPFLFHKQDGRWLSVSWNEVGEKVKLMSLGLMALGVRKGDRIGALSETCPEMAYCCVAIAAAGAVFAPIYHTNSPGECAYVIQDSGATIVFAQDPGQLEKLKAAWSACPHLERIIVFNMEKRDEDTRIIDLGQLIELGRDEFGKYGDPAYVERVLSVKPEDLSAILYTSGTTGPPKGVMDTNAGIIRNLAMLTEWFPVSERSLGISALPMAHGIELMNGHWYHVLYGFPQAYAESIRTLYDDVRAMRPTFFFIPPRFYEKIYNEMMTLLGEAPAWKRGLYRTCMRVGEKYQNMRECAGTTAALIPMRLINGLARLIFFRKVHAKAGGRVQWSSSGGAPIQTKILHFLRSCGWPVYEGYGLTESQGLIALNHPGAFKIGTVGKPSKGLDLKFTEDGEILVNGSARSEGYWNNPEATAELFEDGWLHTGDVGYLDQDGFLHITGRKKEILITSSGKNITPSTIQTLLKTSPYVSEAVVFGEGETYLTALITLNEEKVTEYSRERDIAFSDFPSLSRHPAIAELIRKEIEIKNGELARIEQIKKFTILEDPFRQDRDELTPTMKVKRRVVEQRYRDKIKAMYGK
jgi:long-chain acyl-CoA synthetase